jgi:glycine oxidase
MAHAFWAEVGAASGLPSGYGRTGRLQPLADQAAVDLAQARGVGAAQLWRGLAEWRVVKAQNTPWEPQSPSGYLVEDTLSARVHPRLACAALIAAIRATGGEVLVGHDAPDEGPVIWATGLQGLRDLTADLGRDLGGGVKGQAMSLGYAAPPTAPQLFVDGLHMIPHEDGTIAIGSTSEHVWTGDSVTDSQLEPLYDRAVAALPMLKDAPILHRWAGVRPRAKTRAPLLGAWPERPGHFVANGGFKIGFGMAPKVAEVMVDLVLNGIDAIPDGFRL